jgi:hypothetical protein
MWKQKNKSTIISDFYQGDNIASQLNNSLFGQIKKIFNQDNNYQLPSLGVNMKNLKDSLLLPKVIVIGTESSGKSSLLERITKCQLFPRDNKLCTKCPIKVKLQNGTICIEKHSFSIHSYCI